MAEYQGVMLFLNLEGAWYERGLRQVGNEEILRSSIFINVHLISLFSNWNDLEASKVIHYQGGRETVIAGC